MHLLVMSGLGVVARVRQRGLFSRLRSTVRHDPSVATISMEGSLADLVMRFLICWSYAGRSSFGGGLILCILSWSVSGESHGALYIGLMVGFGVALVMRTNRCKGEICDDGVVMVNDALALR
jgi:hypothetical protein